MSIRVLGPLEVEHGAAALGPRDRVVLGALVVRAGTPVPAEVLADALWPDGPPVSWTKVVQGCIARLRKALGREVIATVPGGYRLDAVPDLVDARRFDDGVARTRELLELHDPHRAVHVAQETLALWTGEPYAELASWDPARIESARLVELHRELEELHLEALLSAGRVRDVLTAAPTAIADAPLRERRWALLATAQYRADRQGEALTTLRRARHALAEGLGVDPSAELCDLEAAVLRHDPGLLATNGLPDASSTCPYLGLVAYDADDADRYFGRDEDRQACLERLEHDGVLVVAGPSGSGKSSFLRAAVVATLRRRGREVVVVSPGPRPQQVAEQLERQLRPGTVLVVDQLEEVRTLGAAPEARQAFLDLVCSHAAVGPVAVSVRADRLGELSEHPGSAALLQRGLHLLTPMGEQDLREVVTGPARQAGLLLEAGLVDLVLRDVEREPGALPLLSHALRQTWLAREGRTLTVAGYTASGGIRGAVALTAEEIYAHAHERQREVMRDLLLRLVVPSTDGAPSRAPVPRRTVPTGDDHERVVQLLVDARLLTSDRETVELAHESLAIAWPRLRAWLDEDVEGLRIRRHLSATADAWESMGRPDTELYRGPRLATARSWRADTAPDLTPSERDFLDTSAAAADADRLAARRRRQVLVGVLAGAAAVAVLFGSVAVVQARAAARERDAALAAEQRAEREAERAATSASVARARELTAAGIAALDRDPALAKLLALSALAEEPTATLETTALLHRTLDADRVVARFAPQDLPVDPWATVFHPDGDRMLLLGGDRAALVALPDLSVRWRWPEEPLPPGAVVDPSAFTESGDEVLIGVVLDPDADDSPPRDALGVHVVAVEDGVSLDRLDVGPCGGKVSGIAGSKVAVMAPREEDGCLVWGRPSAVLLHDTSTDEQQLLSAAHRGWQAPMDPDGTLVATSDAIGLGGVVLIDVDSGERRRIDPTRFGFDEGDGDAEFVHTFSPDGTRLLTGTRRLIVWDVASGEPLSTFAAHGGETLSSAFSSDGQRVFTVGRDGAVWIWDARHGDVVRSLPAVGPGSLSVAPDDRLLHTDDRTGLVTLLDPARPSELAAWDGCESGRGGLAGTLRVAGPFAVATEFCGERFPTFVYDRQTGERLHALPDQGSQATSLSPDGRLLVRQDVERVDDELLTLPPRVRDTRTGELLVELDGVCRYVATADTWTQPGCARFPDLPTSLWSQQLRWSPDGALIAAVQANLGLMVWDATSGEVVHHGLDDCGIGDAWFSDDGTSLVAACGFRDDPLFVRLAVDGWEQLDQVTLPSDVDSTSLLDLAGTSADGSLLVATGQRGGFDASTAVHWFDSSTLELVHSVERAHEGAPKSVAVSPDGALLATGASDGSVKVWDIDGRRQVHELDMGATQVQGLAFVDERHLAIATERPGIEVVTIDDRELLELVRDSLQRGFTATECARFGFGDACPTLEELRG